MTWLKIPDTATFSDTQICLKDILVVVEAYVSYIKKGWKAQRVANEGPKRHISTT